MHAWLCVCVCIWVPAEVYVCVFEFQICIHVGCVLISMKEKAGGGRWGEKGRGL